MIESGAEAQQQPSSVKNLGEIRQSVVREYLESCRATRCPHCHSAVRPLRQESHVKILHGRTPSSRVIKSMLMEKIKLAACYFCFCLCLFISLFDCIVNKRSHK